MAKIDEAGHVVGNGGRARSASVVSLLEVEPGLADALDDHQRDAAARFWLPVAMAEENEDICALLQQSRSFGALVLDGMVLHALQLDDRVTLRLLGPGAVLPVTNATSSVPLGSASLLVPDRVRLVLLGKEFLLAGHRWPWLMARLHARTVERIEVLSTQLAISHLPRVEDRVMALMWLLADSWGRVTSAGVRLPLSLSHEMLGGLIGARRSTVTLALSKLVEHSLLMKQEDGWLILGPRPEPTATELAARQLHVGSSAISPWVASGGVERLGESHLRRDDLARLSQSHRHARQLTEGAKALCDYSQNLRHEVREHRRLRRRTTISG
jgi:CRP/FNR family cyclic AMP-dependent transcriptional regulator